MGVGSVATDVAGVSIGIVGSLLILAGMLWLGTGEWRIWRLFRDVWPR